MPGEIHISRSMRKYFHKQAYRFEINRDFSDTMHRCRAKREQEEGTWITDEMEEAYHRLHRQGYALSLESFEGDVLAGGLYGVVIGRCFFGESMFSERENGSKAALIALAGMLEQKNFLLIDCQFHTPHLESMGGKYISWEDYAGMLREGAVLNY